MDVSLGQMSETARSGGLSSNAYDRLEAMIVSTQLAPGGHYTLQNLEAMAGLGRTPVHDAVKRLAANKLIFVRPRSGLQISPVNLVQERTLLPLRIEMEVFACRLATERATLQDHSAFRQFIRDLEARSHDLSIDAFNVTDRLLNEAILTAAGEPLLENTLMPLQTLYRRSGWLHHTYVKNGSSLRHTIDVHVELLRTIISGDGEAAATYVKKMVAEVFGLLDQLRRHVDPVLLDASLKTLRIDTGL